MSKLNDVAFRLLKDPRGSSETEWLDTLDFLVSRLSETTGCYLHTGVYWISDESNSQSASLVARVRSKSALPGIKSDYWEAAVCYSGSEEGVYADVCAFPFQNGSPILRRGRLADLNSEEELDEFKWYQFTDGRFTDQGWAFPDGPGEWGWIKKPGDEYWQDLWVETALNTFQANQSMMVRLPGLGDSVHRTKTARISLLFVNRDKQKTNLVPWNERPPRPDSKNVLFASEMHFEGGDALFDLSQIRIRGGWKPGKYYLALRSQNFHDENSWTYRSDISLPFKISIV